MWEQMDRAARNGTLFASDEVLRELDKKDDGAHDWMDARPEMIVKLDSEIEEPCKKSWLDILGWSTARKADPAVTRS